MRTTLDLPSGLVEEARDAVGFTSKTDTVVFALREIRPPQPCRGAEGHVRNDADRPLHPAIEAAAGEGVAVIAVDTSVWVSALRSREAPEAATLSALLDAGEVMLPVPVRLRSPARSLARASCSSPPRALALPVAYPSDDTWALMDTWASKAADAGHRFGAGDSADRGGYCVGEAPSSGRLDRDFARMERLRFVSLSGIAPIQNPEPRPRSTQSGPSAHQALRSRTFDNCRRARARSSRAVRQAAAPVSVQELALLRSSVFQRGHV